MAVAVNDSDDSGTEANDIETSRIEAHTIAKRVAAKVFDSTTVYELEHLAHGAYNWVWLVTYDSSEKGDRPGKRGKFVVRVPRDEDEAILQPYRIRNHVACLSWLNSNVPSIPVPKLYDWSDGCDGTGPRFTVEEYIDGQRLSLVWPQLTEGQKTNVCREIATAIADLGQTRFNAIGSLTPGTASTTTVLGPTVEAAKVFNGRYKDHSRDCYDIGPYDNSKQYILACYDREIYFYRHAEHEDIEDFFEDTNVADFIAHLEQERNDLVNADDDVFQQIDLEPRVLVHLDFHASNMLVRDGRLVAILDWDFAGIYPLSQLLGRARILQISGDQRSKDVENEEDRWDERYHRMVGKIVKRRGWPEEHVEALVGRGHKLLNAARRVMIP